MPTGDNSQEVVCGCFNLTRAALERAAAGSNFERFLEETRAGSRCTACLLDVEYIFVNAPKNPAAAAAGSAVTRTERPSLKRRIYGVLDRIAPQIPFRLTNTIPLLSGRGIVERIWLVNQPMVFGKKVGVPPHRFLLTVRDGEGNVLGHQRHDVACGESKAIAFPEMAAQGANEISVGSVEIARWGLAPGVRGTTRPHFEVQAAHSNTTLHVQGASPDPEAWLTTVHRPAETRILFSAVNVASRPLMIEAEAGANPPARVKIPPYGARLIEPPADASAPGEPITYHYRARGRGKIHVVTASPALDRLALDHL